MLRAQESRPECVAEHRGGAAAAAGGTPAWGQCRELCSAGVTPEGSSGWISAQNKHGSSTDLIPELEGMTEQCRTRFQMPQKSCWVTQPCTALSLYYPRVKPWGCLQTGVNLMWTKDSSLSNPWVNFNLFCLFYLSKKKSCLALKSSPSFPLEKCGGGFEEANISPMDFPPFKSSFIPHPFLFCFGSTSGHGPGCLEVPLPMPGDPSLCFHFNFRAGIAAELQGIPWV